MRAVLVVLLLASAMVVDSTNSSEVLDPVANAVGSVNSSTGVDGDVDAQAIDLCPDRIPACECAEQLGEMVKVGAQMVGKCVKSVFSGFKFVFNLDEFEEGCQEVKADGGECKNAVISSVSQIIRTGDACSGGLIGRWVSTDKWFDAEVRFAGFSSRRT